MGVEGPGQERFAQGQNPGYRCHDVGGQRGGTVEGMESHERGRFVDLPREGHFELPEPITLDVFVEGLNAKAKLTTRKAYGYKTFKTLQLALYHNLGVLPEPEIAHRFF